MARKPKRRMVIREIENGFIVETLIDKEDLSSATTMRLSRQELAVDSLTKLLRLVKTFFEPEVMEE